MTDALWLADAGHPALSGPNAQRISDPHRPDRLAWNCFRTLALWDSEVWVPPFLEAACGNRNPLSGLGWGQTATEFWSTAADQPDATDVVLSGPEAVIIVQASVDRFPGIDVLYEGIERALEVAAGRQAGFVLLNPPADDELLARFDDAVAAGLDPISEPGHGLRVEAVAPMVGRATWLDIAELLLDLAEESPDDHLRQEQVRRLVSEVQYAFPGAAM